MEQIICIVGATATGKTALSVKLAQSLSAEIVSCDSMQIYRGMDIGTAKPREAERGGIRHHMIDFLDPRESYSVGRYVADADRCVQEILSRGKPVLIVGGTGLYVDSLIAGRQFAPIPSTGRREELMQIAQTQGIAPLLSRLREVDPIAAQSIHPSNQKRIIRALEVYLETGKTLTEYNALTKLQPPRYRPIWIGLDYERREVLYRRIDRRVESMLESGLVDEVRRLLDGGVPADATAMQAIGYKELTAYLRGEAELQQAKETIQQASRRYAKRQRTWFRRNEEIHWLNLPDEPNLSAMAAEAQRLLENGRKRCGNTE